jgi:hypothetical protein
MNFIATIEESANMEQVVAQLKKLGYSILRVRQMSGNISGNTNNKTINDLRSVKGIKFAEEERKITKA